MFDETIPVMRGCLWPATMWRGFKREDRKVIGIGAMLDQDFDQREIALYSRDG